MPYSRNALLVCALACVSAAFAVSAFAAESSDAALIRELQSKLERSLQLIEALQDRVQRLESARTEDKAKPHASPGATEQLARIKELEQEVTQLGSGLALRRSDTGVPLHGFADVGLRRSGENNPAYGKGRKGFNVGTFDLFIAPQFGDRVRMLVEPIIEVDQSGNATLDLERLQIGYSASDLLTAWAGRFHTPIGYWNTAYHHGAQIQTSVLRPRFLDFEDRGGILPVHTTGLWFTGAVPYAANKFGYDLYAGNSQQIRTDPANPVGPGRISTGSLDTKMAGSSSGNAIVGFNAWMSPARSPDLRFGLHGLRSNIAAVDGSSALLEQARLQVLGGYAVYSSDRWEMMSEYYRFNNSAVAGGSSRHMSSAWYGQAAYNLGLYTPYARLERTALDQNDPYFAFQTNGRSYRRVAFGLRYEVDPRSAIKIEFNRTRKRDLVDASTAVPAADDGYAETLIQYSVRF